MRHVRVLSVATRAAPSSTIPPAPERDITPQGPSTWRLTQAVDGRLLLYWMGVPLCTTFSKRPQRVRKG